MGRRTLLCWPEREQVRPAFPIRRAGVVPELGRGGRGRWSWRRRSARSTHVLYLVLSVRRRKDNKVRLTPQFEFSLPAIVKKRRKWYLAICPPLDIASQGPTKEKALDNLKDAVRGFLADCFERGTLEQVLREAGFVSARRPLSKRTQSSGVRWLTVPIALLAREQQPARSYEKA